jgi:hypothetical protein
MKPPMGVVPEALPPLVAETWEKIARNEKSKDQFIVA